MTCDKTKRRSDNIAVNSMYEDDNDDADDDNFVVSAASAHRKIKQNKHQKRSVLTWDLMLSVNTSTFVFFFFLYSCCSRLSMHKLCSKYWIIINNGGRDDFKNGIAAKWCWRRKWKLVEKAIEWDLTSCVNIYLICYIDDNNNNNNKFHELWVSIFKEYARITRSERFDAFISKFKFNKILAFSHAEMSDWTKVFNCTVNVRLYSVNNNSQFQLTAD